MQTPYGSDRGPRHVAPAQGVLQVPPGLDCVDAGEGPARGFVIVADSADVVSRAEVLAVGLQDDHSDVVVGRCRLPGLVEVVEHLQGHGVGHLRSLQRDRRDPSFDRVVDERRFHGFP